jgi:hypothetical protein
MYFLEFLDFEKKSIWCIFKRKPCSVEIGKNLDELGSSVIKVYVFVSFGFLLILFAILGEIKNFLLLLYIHRNALFKITEKG